MASDPRKRDRFHAAQRVRASIFQGRAQVQPGGCERRRHAEQDCGAGGTGHGEGEHAGINGDEAGDRTRQQKAESRGGAPGNENAEESAGGAQHDALGEQQPDHAGAGGADGGADGDFSFARHRAGEKQVGDIGADDQQNASDRAHQDVDGSARTGYELVLQRDDPDKRPRAQGEERIGELAVEALGDHLEIGAGLTQGDSWFQAADYRQIGKGAAGNRAGGVHGIGQPERGAVGLRIYELRRQHADHGVRSPVEEDSHAHDIGPGAQVAAPERIADEGDGISAGFALIGLEVAAEAGLNAEHGKELGRDVTGLYSCGGVVRSGQVLPTRRLICGQPLEYGVLPLPGRIVGHHDHGVVGLGIERSYPGEPLWRGVGERPQKSGVDDAEDRGVRADAESERHDCGGGELRALGKIPKRVPAVPKEVGQPRNGGLVAHRVGSLHEAAGLEPRFANGRAAAQGGFLGHFEVEAELLFHVVAAIGYCGPDA